LLFYAPKILGGDDGLPMFRGQGAAWMKDALALHDVTMERVGEDIMVVRHMECGKRFAIYSEQSIEFMFTGIIEGLGTLVGIRAAGEARIHRGR
jgi:hypothetical protein